MTEISSAPSTTPVSGDALPLVREVDGVSTLFRVDPTSLGAETWNFRGAWVASTAYAVDDVLTYGGSSYLVTTAFTSGATFATTDLSIIAEKGDDGEPGTNGTDGTNGEDGAAGVGIATVTATQSAVTAGENSTVTLNITKTDGSVVNPAPSFVSPPGAPGSGSGGSSTIPVTTATISTATYALPASASGDAAYDLTIAAATTLSLSGGTTGQMQRVFLQLRQTGSFAVTLPANVKWNGGTAPTVTQISGQIAQFVLATLDGGTTWTGQEGF